MRILQEGLHSSATAWSGNYQCKVSILYYNFWIFTSPDDPRSSYFGEEMIEGKIQRTENDASMSETEKYIETFRGQAMAILHALAVLMDGFCSSIHSGLILT